MLNPFHLSFVVPDKEEAKRFYLDILGCSIGRDNPTWFDILFYGHQITIHQASDKMPAYQIDHFGPILSKEEWLSVLEVCKSNDVEFVASSLIKNEGAEDESGKFLIKDPSGNTLEFKYYMNFERTVG
ncbi:VOC family protein [Microbulbifer sp. JMSA003]|uniref:VOC family protein n=1 Tax=unclassified Microbulbifer TaxID=2619833 RepID=UPI00403A3AC5